MPLSFFDLVVTVFLSKNVELRARKTGVWIDLQCRQRPWNRCSSNIRDYGSA